MARDGAGDKARARAEGKAGGVRRLRVDEKTIAKGHQYLTLVSDLMLVWLGYFGEDSKNESLAAYYEGMSGEQWGDQGGGDGQMGAL